MRDRLSILIDDAELKARSCDPGQRRAGSSARELGLRLRQMAARDSQVALAVDDAFAIVDLLQVQRIATRKLDYETLVAAIKTSNSMKEVAAKVDRHPRTVARLVKTLSGHGVAGVQLANAPSLQRSKSMKAKRMGEAT
jgi:hypothetical protein